MEEAPEYGKESLHSARADETYESRLTCLSIMSALKAAV